jgi:hypothetical protein
MVLFEPAVVAGDIISLLDSISISSHKKGCFSSYSEVILSLGSTFSILLNRSIAFPSTFR